MKYHYRTRSIKNLLALNIADFFDTMYKMPFADTLLRFRNPICFMSFIMSSWLETRGRFFRLIHPQTEYPSSRPRPHKRGHILFSPSSPRRQDIPPTAPQSWLHSRNRHTPSRQTGVLSQSNTVFFSFFVDLCSVIQNPYPDHFPDNPCITDHKILKGNENILVIRVLRVKSDAVCFSVICL